MFVDASAIVAIIAREPNWEELMSVVVKTLHCSTSPLSHYEAVLAIARLRKIEATDAQGLVDEFLDKNVIGIMPVDEQIGIEAILAFGRFGKGRHRAGLNMGDCFSYACAKIHKVPLLFKGDDFIHTDIAIA